MPKFRQYLKSENVIWRALYAKIWKGEDDIDTDEMFWYRQIPNLRGDLYPFHLNLQNRVSTIFQLHNFGGDLMARDSNRIHRTYAELLNHPLGDRLFIPVYGDNDKYILNTEMLTTIAKCFIIFMHLEDVCSFNGIYVRDMWDLLKECIIGSRANFSDNIAQSKASFDKI